MSRGHLEVHLYGTHIGDIADTDRLPAFTFTDAALRRWGIGSRVVGHKLPTSQDAPHRRLAATFFAGLLPEGRERVRHAERAGVVADDLFGLLYHYGRDTIGALDIRRPDEPEDAGQLRPASEDEIRALLTSSPDVKAGIYGRGSRTSLPGLQPKVGLTLTPRGWSLPSGGALSTHIIKLGAGPDTVAADVIDTEVAVLDLARRAGFEAPRAWIELFAGARTIVVERFDRKMAGESVSRIHQEDGAQALGLNTDDPDRKFQRGGRHLPSWRALAAVLTDSFSEPDGLLRLVTFKHAVGDVDFHAKNVSFLRRQDGSIKVAPVYDSAMHMHEPNGHDGRSAIEINGKSDMDAITAADLVAEAASWPIPERRAQRIVTQALERLAAALDEISPSDHPGVGDRAWSVVRERVGRLSAESLKTMKTSKKTKKMSKPIRG
ncbi:type II toxin-antitoxin system HipA family toxin [Georgenia subflava]|uniref:Type II toxin-antitoxin system HipA family toxin n=1 Tax=Georgenia subflava TaxID=1622177 RepID=A0A6N7EHQ1_9MICO|nr:HipA domain-containing protein [Georgenia subflava]MPV36951.1 hypothetical protein [Georgenia subflava]